MVKREKYFNNKTRKINPIINMESDFLKKKNSSLKIALNLFVNNYALFIKSCGNTIYTIREYVNKNYTFDKKDKKIVFPPPTEEHKMILESVNFNFINLLNSYKMVVELLVKIKNHYTEKSINMPSNISNFISILQNNTMLRSYNLDPKVSNGKYIIVRNSFNHDTVINTSFSLRHPGEISEFDLYINLTKSNNLSNSELKSKILEEKKKLTGRIGHQAINGEYKVYVQVELIMNLNELPQDRTKELSPNEKLFYIFKDSFELYFIVMEDLFKLIDTL